MRGGREPGLACGLVVQLTMTVVVATLLPLGLGILLDRLLHTSPLFILFTTMFGMLAGTVSIYRTVAREYKRIGGDK